MLLTKYLKFKFQDEEQIEEDMDDESLGIARVSEEILTVVQRARDRKLEEMKRYELQQQLESTKFKKMDGENKENKVNISKYL